MNLIDRVDWKKCNNLVPAIIQHHENGQVLMLGYMNKEALKISQEKGLVTFWSRTREVLWTKGETSGNTLAIKSMQLDCDNDTILVIAEPQGPTCHTGSDSCFDNLPTGIGWLNYLEKVIDCRRQDADDKKSYTASLFKSGIERIAQKVGEEGVETAIAAVADQPTLKEESADLIFHLLVLLNAKDLSLDEVIEVLRARHK